MRQLPLVLGGVLSGTALIATVRTLRLNQIQTEYLVPFDGWHFLEKLQAGASAVVLLSHTLRMVAVPYLLFWLDLELSDGSLRFLHGATLAFCAAALAAVAAVAADVLRGAAFAVICTLLLCSGMWLSQSNQNTFAYPIVDVMASFTLLATIGVALIGGRLQRGGVGVWLPALALVTVAGFYTGEVTVAALVCVVGEAAVRRNWRLTLSVAALTILLFLSYWMVLPPQVHAEFVDDPFILLLSLRNGLLLLSDQVMYLVLARGFEGSTNVAIAMSCLQLTYGAYVVALLWRGERRLNDLDRIGLSLMAVAVAAIGAAVWLRHGAAPVGAPVLRYTWYATLFSIGSTLLACNGLIRGSGRLDALLAGTVVCALGAYCLADIPVQNAGERWLRARGEMSIYASNPGYEENLGPVTVEGGADVRARLYPFLKREGLFAFGSPPYRLVGMRFAGERIDGQECRIETESTESRKDKLLWQISVSGISAGRNGTFLLVGDQSTVEAFSYAERVDWRGDTVAARFLSDREKPRAKLVWVPDVTDPRLRYSECERR
jgi:hypothetical protein